MATAMKTDSVFQYNIIQTYKLLANPDNKILALASIGKHNPSKSMQHEE